MRWREWRSFQCVRSSPRILWKVRKRERERKRERGSECETETEAETDTKKETEIERENICVCGACVSASEWGENRYMHRREREKGKEENARVEM